MHSRITELSRFKNKTERSARNGQRLPKNVYLLSLKIFALSRLKAELNQYLTQLRVREVLRSCTQP